MRPAGRDVAAARAVFKTQIALILADITPARGNLRQSAKSAFCWCRSRSSGPAQLRRPRARVGGFLGERGANGIGRRCDIDARMYARAERRLHQPIFTAVEADDR